MKEETPSLKSSRLELQIQEVLKALLGVNDTVAVWIEERPVQQVQTQVHRVIPLCWVHTVVTAVTPAQKERSTLALKVRASWKKCCRLKHQ